MGTPELMKRLAEHIRLRKQTGTRLYHLLLSAPQGEQRTLEGYRALVYLAKNGYFSTILTTHHDEMLEYALREQSLSPPNHQILVIGQDACEQIVRAFDDLKSGVCVIEFHRENEADNTMMAAEYIREPLQRYLNQEIIIVGSIEYENEIIAALHPQQPNSIYFVLPQRLTSHATNTQAMHRQGKQPIFLLEPYDEFDNFFQALAGLIAPGRSHVAPEKGSVVGQNSPLLEKNGLPTPAQLHKQAGQLSTPAQHASPRTAKKLKADILLVTATAAETKAVLDLFALRDRVSIDGRKYHQLGLVKGSRIFMVQLSHIGSNGPGGSRATVAEGIQALSPWAVIMVGIAFGVDSEKQRIGDILVAQEIQDYDPERVGSAPDLRPVNYPRGARVKTSVRLLNNFMAGQYDLPGDWLNPPGIKFGLMLSGSKLIDQSQFRGQLLNIAPEAIGGEMEGVGLYDAAAEKKVDWLLIKAISDWADGNKHENKSVYQKLAAENAARFTVHVLHQGGFTRPRR